MTETQYGNWNADNKTQWWGPATIGQVMQLYWLVKKANLTYSGGSTTWKTNVHTLTWSGTSWGNPTGSNATVFWPSAENQDALGCKTGTITEVVAPEEYACNGKRFSKTTTTVSSTDSRFHYSDLFLDFFVTSIPQSSGITSARWLYRPETDLYYVPIVSQVVMSNNPAVYDFVGFGSTDAPPPDPKYEGSDLTHLLGHTSGNTSYFNPGRPTLIVDVLGVSITLIYPRSTTDLTIDTMALTWFVDPEDPDYFYTL